MVYIRDAVLDRETQAFLVKRGLQRVLGIGSSAYIDKVILFGSGARYQLTSHSDLDICVVTLEAQYLRQVKKDIALQPRCEDDQVAYDILCYDRETFSQRAALGGICQIISEDGLLIYERRSCG